VAGVLGGGGSNNNGMEGANLVLNPSFETTNTSWILEAAGGSNATLVNDTVSPLVGTNVAKLNIQSPQSDIAAVGVTQTGINLVDGVTYSVSVGARSEKPVNGEAVIQNSTGQVLFRLPVYSTSEWKRFSGTFQNQGTNSKSKLEINFGGALGNVWVDDVKINSISDGGSNTNIDSN
jgi:hypothetical protein